MIRAEYSNNNESPMAGGGGNQGSAITVNSNMETHIVNQN